MGFADEVKQVIAKPSRAPAVEKTESTEKQPQGPEDAPLLATGTRPVDPATPIVKIVEVEAKPKPETETPEVARPEVSKIKIAGKEFSSVEEAIAYAEQLELAQREDKAFQEGYQKAKEGDQPPAPQKSLDDEVEELFFENPKEAIKKLREGIQQEIWSAYQNMTQQQSQAVRLEAERNQMWEQFYQANSDLAESREYVDFVMKKNWDALKDKKLEQSLTELADMARKGLKISKEAALPKTELPNKPVIMPGASGDATTQQTEVTAAQPLDFIQQLNKLRKRK